MPREAVGAGGTKEGRKCIEDIVFRNEHGVAAPPAVCSTNGIRAFLTCISRKKEEKQFSIFRSRDFNFWVRDPALGVQMLKKQYV